MTQKELIRQKIEELKKTLEESNYYLDNSEQALGYSLALDDFKEFIDSLPEEKPSEDLEEEIKSWQKEGLHFPWCSVSETIERTARHFVEWGRMRFRDTEKSQSFTSLEEAAKEYATTHLSNNEFPTADSAFIAGAKWQYKNTITFLSEVMFQDMKKGICGWGEIPEKK